MSAPRPVVEAENRLERFNSERDSIVDEVTRRVVKIHLAAAEASPERQLEYVLNEVAFAEIRRYESGRSREARKKLQRWRDLAHRLGHMSEADKRAELESQVRFYAIDIAGNFNPRVYRFANDVLPPALSFLLQPISSVREGVKALGSWAEEVQVEGPLEQIRSVCDRGTLVIAPTHSSNLDSIVVGFGLARSGLPPATYGAGKNLFTNPLVSYFMHNLGAYRVDRRLKFSLYKEVLKEYSTVLLERGYHSLFFPGGTRSRSNRVEQHLKLGLLGTALAAYENNVLRGEAQRRIYIVPVTINYRLVLEAETLIEDYLEETGKSRYIIEDDEFSRAGRVVEFLRKLLAHESAVVLGFGTPLDPFGNPVDDEGESLDRRGRRVDPASYVMDGEGKAVADRQRDAVYTRSLGDAVAESYLRDTFFLPTHLVCRALFDAVSRRSGIRDLYQLLRLPPSAVSVSIDEVASGIDRLRQRLAEHPEWGQVDSRVRAMAPRDMIADAVRSLGTYHTRPVAYLSGDSMRPGYMKLLFYYRNRTDHIPAEERS